MVAHQSSAASDIRTNIFRYPPLDPTDPALAADPANYLSPAASTGRLKGFTTADFAAGMEWDNYSAELYLENAFDERAQLSRFQECGQCFQRPYIVTNTPRTIGVRAGYKF